jgi:hypothetical protein
MSSSSKTNTTSNQHRRPPSTRSTRSTRTWAPTAGQHRRPAPTSTTTRNNPGDRDHDDHQERDRHQQNQQEQKHHEQDQQLRQRHQDDQLRHEQQQNDPQHMSNTNEISSIDHRQQRRKGRGRRRHCQGFGRLQTSNTALLSYSTIIQHTQGQEHKAWSKRKKPTKTPHFSNVDFQWTWITIPAPWRLVPANKLSLRVLAEDYIHLLTTAMISATWSQLHFRSPLLNSAPLCVHLGFWITNARARAACKRGQRRRVERRRWRGRSRGSVNSPRARKGDGSEARGSGGATRRAVHLLTLAAWVTRRWVSRWMRGTSPHLIHRMTGRVCRLFLHGRELGVAYARIFEATGRFNCILLSWSVPQLEFGDRRSARIH